MFYVILIASGKPRSARGASHQPALTGSRLTISHTRLPCPPGGTVSPCVLRLTEVRSCCHYKKRVWKSWTQPATPPLNKTRNFPPSHLIIFPGFPPCHFTTLPLFPPCHLTIFPPHHLTILPSTNKALQNNNIKPFVSPRIDF